MTSRAVHSSGTQPGAVGQHASMSSTVPLKQPQSAQHPSGSSTGLPSGHSSLATQTHQPVQSSHGGVGPHGYPYPPSNFPLHLFDSDTGDAGAEEAYPDDDGFEEGEEEEQPGHQLSGVNHATGHQQEDDEDEEGDHAMPEEDEMDEYGEQGYSHGYGSSAAHTGHASY